MVREREGGSSEGDSSDFQPRPEEGGELHQPLPVGNGNGTYWERMGRIDDPLKLLGVHTELLMRAPLMTRY